MLGGIVFTLVISVALPIFLVILLRIKNKTGLLAALIGAVAFFLFALVLEPLLHSVVIPVVLNIPWAYVVYGCLAAGVFEETSRFLGFKLLNKFRKNSFADAISYGIGHGGIEAVLIVGIPFISQLFTYLSPNGSLFLTSFPPSTFYIAGVERFLAMALHLSLSLIMWLVATKRVSRAFWGVCIALHAFANTGAAMMQAGIIKSLVAVYAILIITTISAYLLFFKLQKTAAQQPIQAENAKITIPENANGTIL